MFSKLDWHYVATVSTLVGSEDAETISTLSIRSGDLVYIVENPCSYNFMIDSTVINIFLIIQFFVAVSASTNNTMYD